MALINWHWLEDLLVRACELEIREFSERQGDDPCFAFCLEFEGLDGSIRLSYGTRAAVDAAARRLQLELGDGIAYRSVELQPENWRFRDEPIADPEGYWSRAKPLQAQYAAIMSEDNEPEKAEFFWLRFEYLTECVIRRLTDRDAFRRLNTERDFLAYSLCREECMEELEDRLVKLYPAYRRATMEWSTSARPGEFDAGSCDGTACGRSLARAVLARCTHCQGWFCEACREEHGHPELAKRQSFWL